MQKILELVKSGKNSNELLFCFQKSTSRFYKLKQDDKTGEDKNLYCLPFSIGPFPLKSWKIPNSWDKFSVGFTDWKETC